MTPQVPYVSVVDPIGPAIERVKMILFRPFSLERWLVIGFCAWLAQLGEAGGGGGGGEVGHIVNRVKRTRSETAPNKPRNSCSTICTGSFLWRSSL